MSDESIYNEANEQFKEIIKKLSVEGYDSFNKKISSKELKSGKETFDFFKVSLINFLKEESDNQKSKISNLRKKGKDVSSISLNMMSVPLKIKIFQASYEKDDFFKCLDIIDKIKSELFTFEKEESKKEIEKISVDKIKE